MKLAIITDGALFNANLQLLINSLPSVTLRTINDVFLLHCILIMQAKKNTWVAFFVCNVIWIAKNANGFNFKNSIFYIFT